MDIQEITLLSNNLAETLAFYSGVIGLPVFNQEGQSLSFSAGKSILTFEESAAIKHPTYHFAFNIPENQIQEAVNWCRDKVELLQITESSKIADYRQWNAHAVYFLDNNGNVVELIARHDLQNSASKTFTAAAITGISEIGLVTEKVPSFTHTLLDTYHLTLFSKQPMQPGFAAIGDDHGLLIIVGKGRCWFPTEVPSEQFPLSILINNGIVEQLLLFE